MYCVASYEQAYKLHSHSMKLAKDSKPLSIYCKTVCEGTTALAILADVWTWGLVQKQSTGELTAETGNDWLCMSSNTMLTYKETGGLSSPTRMATACSWGVCGIAM